MDVNPSRPPFEKGRRASIAPIAPKPAIAPNFGIWGRSAPNGRLVLAILSLCRRQGNFLSFFHRPAIFCHSLLLCLWRQDSPRRKCLWLLTLLSGQTRYFRIFFYPAKKVCMILASSFFKVAGISPTNPIPSRIRILSL